MHTFFLVLVLGNRHTSHLDSLEPYICNAMTAWLICQADALVFFLVAICRELSRFWFHIHANSVCRWRLLLICICGYGQFYTDILRFNRILSCWFCNKCMRLKTCVYSTPPRVLPICLYREAICLQCFTPTHYIVNEEYSSRTRTYYVDNLYPICSKQLCNRVSMLGSTAHVATL